MTRRDNILQTTLKDRFCQINRTMMNIALVKPEMIEC